MGFYVNLATLHFLNYFLFILFDVYERFALV